MWIKLRKNLKTKDMEDKFTKRAFEEAEKQALDTEAKAWEKFSKETENFANKLSFELTCSTMIGQEKHMQLIKLAMDAGLDGVLKEYRYYSMMLGFKGGYAAGRLSVLEEPNNK